MISFYSQYYDHSMLKVLARDLFYSMFGSNWLSITRASQCSAFRSTEQEAMHYICPDVLLPWNLGHQMELQGWSTPLGAYCLCSCNETLLALESNQKLILGDVEGTDVSESEAKLQKNQINMLGVSVKQKDSSFVRPKEALYGWGFISGR